MKKFLIYFYKVRNGFIIIFFGCFHAGFDEYEFISLGENAENVCGTCDDLDGQRFKIADAVVGVNCPPMHPFCRCKVTTPQQSEEDIQREIDERIDSWNIPEGMSLDEFIDRVNNGELEEIRKEQDSTLNSVQESVQGNTSSD
ncbi:MAG: minor capsid protein, partial [Oscillospiraceae bacterium]|nr:minor capsid protein [Oscillospiraceae bacterium]